MEVVFVPRKARCAKADQINTEAFFQESQFRFRVAPVGVAIWCLFLLAAWRQHGTRNQVAAAAAGSTRLSQVVVSEREICSHFAFLHSTNADCQKRGWIRLGQETQLLRDESGILFRCSFRKASYQSAALLQRSRITG